MAVTPAPVRQVEFLLDRLTAADGRITVEGRWYGVVGRRFLRPNLQIEGRRRLIARLEHKPWAADDGAPWCAAFDCDPTQPVGASLLQVAPDIAIELPPPGAELVDERRRPRVALAAPAEPVEREETELERLRAVIDQLRDELDEARAEAARTLQERDGAREDAERAEKSLERLREELDQLRERERRAMATAEVLRRERDAARLQAVQPGENAIGALPTGERPPIFTMSRRRTFYGPKVAAALGVLAALATVIWIL